MEEIKLFEFEHIALLSDSDRKKLVDSVSELDLIPALKEKNPRLLSLCVDAMEHQFDFLVSFLAWGKIPLEESRYYQRRIMRKVSDLVQKNEITLPEGFKIQTEFEADPFIADFEVYDHYEWPRTFEDIYEMDVFDIRVIKENIDQKDFELCQKSHEAKTKDEIKAVQLAQYCIMKTIRSLKASGKIRGMWKYHGYPRKRIHD